jgi:hypothetical protein
MKLEKKINLKKKNKSIRLTRDPDHETRTTQLKASPMLKDS